MEIAMESLELQAKENMNPSVCILFKFVEIGILATPFPLTKASDLFVPVKHIQFLIPVSNKVVLVTLVPLIQQCQAHNLQAGSSLWSCCLAT